MVVHEATVWVEAPGALNSPQSFGVCVQVAATPPPHPTGTVVDDIDPEFECTPYFWIGHRFHGWGWPELREAEGCGHFYRMNGLRDRAGEFARFNPDLAAGVYEFEEGTDGWIDILAEDSTGQVLVDAIRFLRRDPV